MKKFIYSLFVLLFVSFAATAQEAMKASIGKFSIDIPQGWLVQNLGGQVPMLIYAPSDGTFNYNITVTPEKVASKITVEQARDMFWNGIIATYPDVEVQEQGKDYIVYQGVVSDVSVVQYVKVLQAKDTFYFLCFTANSAEAFLSYRGTVDQIYSTAKIK